MRAWNAWLRIVSNSFRIACKNYAGHARKRLPGEDGAVCSAEDKAARRRDSTPRLQEFSQQSATKAASLADPNRNRTRLQKIYGMSEFDSMDGRNALTGSRLATCRRGRAGDVDYMLLQIARDKAHHAASA